MASEGWDVQDMPSQVGKIAIVTGANSGVGYATATALAAKGAHVILACPQSSLGRESERDIRDREKAQSDKVEFMKLDLGCFKSTRTFARNVHKKFQRIDILINNAGVLHPEERVTKEGHEAHFGINYLGHFYLTALLFDLLKQSTEARVVNLSSMIHRIADVDFDTVGYPYEMTRVQVMPDYSTSKFCCLMFTYELHRRLQKAGVTNIKAVACHPGVALTKMANSSMHAHMLPAKLQGWLMGLMGLTPIFQSAEMGALPSLYAATSEMVLSGEFFGPDGWGACWGRAVVRCEPLA